MNDALYVWELDIEMVEFYIDLLRDYLKTHDDAGVEYDLRAMDNWLLDQLALEELDR